MAGIFGFLRRKPRKATLRQERGREGERAAERFLKRHGYRVVARNVTYPQGEVDLVALEKRTGTICFVEVRSREAAGRRGRPILPEETVKLTKRRRVIRAAYEFLALRRATDRTIRFDVVAVRFGGDRKRPEVRHIPGAFDGAGRAM